jgi:prepilin-type N-terminal cleavage/methylation domain-containing protein/prepilin-type processing-associated H-X9-DG protein
MKPRFANQRNHALTLTEVLVVIVVLAVLAVVGMHVLIVIATRNNGADRINCVSNLKQIGLAYRLWAGDHNDKYAMQVSVTNGGAMELIATGNVVACFQVMSNELSTPRILVCPADDKSVWVTNFTTDFSSKNISYFVGVDADQDHPQRILSGDDNFEIGGVPVKSGLLGISTNTRIAWTSARHKYAGNIGFADGSVQEVTTEGLQNALRQTGLATNRLAIP